MADPSFGGFIQHWTTVDSPDEAHTHITLTGSIPAGSTVIVSVFVNHNTNVASSVEDAGGSYTGDLSYYANRRYQIFSHYTSSGLAVNDVITVTWNAQVYVGKFGAVQYLTNVASSSPVDASKTNSAYNDSPSATESTTVTTSMVGIINGADKTYSNSNWTIDDTYSTGYFVIYFLHKDASSGSQNPGGTLSGVDSWDVVWVAYKGVAGGGGIANFPPGKRRSSTLLRM